MKFIATFSLLFCLCIAPQLTVADKPADPAKPPAANTNIVEQTCERTPYKAFCSNSLKSDPTSAQSDDFGLALIAIKQASAHASNMSEHVKVLFEDKSLSEPASQQALDDCFDNYLDATDQLDDSVSALLAKAYPDVKTWIKVAMEDAQACEAGFRGKPNALTEENKVFMQLCNLAVALTSLLPGGV